MSRRNFLGTLCGRIGRGLRKSCRYRLRPIRPWVQGPASVQAAGPASVPALALLGPAFPLAASVWLAFLVGTARRRFRGAFQGGTKQPRLGRAGPGH